MKKLFQSLKLLFGTFSVVLFMISCSNTQKKANEYIAKLGENDKVLGIDLLGEDKKVIASVHVNDTIKAAIVYSLETETVDTVTSISSNAEACEVLPVNSGYLIITRGNRPDGNYHYLYQAYIIRNHKDPKTRTVQNLLVDKDFKNLACSGYVIDKESKTLTLASYTVNDEDVIIYHTVYDFDGNQIVEDPLNIDITPIMPTPSHDETTYIWECQYCREKRNSKTNPGPWEFTCHGRGERPGFGNSHKWVKIGRVD